METAFVGPDRAGLGHATGRNGPGPKLNSGPRAGPGREVYGKGRADKIRPVQISAGLVKVCLPPTIAGCPAKWQV